MLPLASNLSPTYEPIKSLPKSPKGTFLNIFAIFNFESIDMMIMIDSFPNLCRFSNDGFPQIILHISNQFFTHSQMLITDLYVNKKVNRDIQARPCIQGSKHCLIRCLWMCLLLSFEFRFRSWHLATSGPKRRFFFKKPVTLKVRT